MNNVPMTHPRAAHHADVAIAALYEAVLDDGPVDDAGPSSARMTAAVEAIARCFDASAGTLWRFDAQTGRFGEIWMHGHDPAAMQAYADHFVHIDPATPQVLSAGVGRWLADEPLLDARNPAHRFYLNEFALPHGIGRVGGGAVAQTPEGLLYLGLQRAPDAARFGTAATDLFTRLAPHLARADALRQRLRRLSAGRRLALAALDQLSLGLCVADAAGRVRLVNAAWERQLALSAPVSIRGRVLRAGAGLADTWLTMALALACAPTPRASARWVPQAGGPGWSLAVLPLPVGHELGEGAEGRLALLTQSRPADAVATPELMRSVFGLTVAEAHLLAAMAAGRTVQAHADERRVSVHTVRTHAGALLAKLGCHSQLELVALARALPPWQPDR